MLWKWTISYSSSFSCWFIIYFPVGGKPSFSIFFSNWELQKLECVCSMYPQRVGTNASFTKICCNEGFLPSSVGQFTAHSAGWLIRNLASCTNRSGLSVQAANGSKPPPLPPRARICKRLWSPGIDSEESISPAYVAWRASTTNRVSYRPARLRIDTWRSTNTGSVPVLATLTIQLNKTAAELLCLKDIFIYIFF